MAHLEVMKYCVRAWLDDVKQRTIVIEDVSERIRRIESALRLRGVRFDKIGASAPTDSTVSDGLIRLQELRAEWSDRVEECTGVFREAYNLCGPEYPNRYVVWLHDYEGMKWEKVGERVNYSEPQARRIAKIGYREIYEVMPEEWRRAPIPDAQPGR